MEEYGDDILYVGWNPEVGSVNQQLQLANTAKQNDMSGTFTPKEPESFLRRIYSFQR
jgi:hypothetical protein